MTALLLLLLLSPTVPESGAATPCRTPCRVGGDLEVTVRAVGEGWRSGFCRITTALPDGYPPPTAPGAVEIKSYPVVRRAQVDDEQAGGAGGFWPLFNHIQERGIAMTSPVEMDFHGMSPDGEAVGDGWTMSFLYRSQDLGPTGRDGVVEIVDVPALTVLAVGVQGPYRGDAMVRAHELLGEWLTGQDEWVAAGDVRALQYNGPSVPSPDKWGELQVPIRRAGDASP